MSKALAQLAVAALMLVGVGIALGAAAAERPAAGETAAGKPPTGGSPPTGNGGRPSAAAIFKRLDGDGDGAVTAEEYVARSIHKADPDNARKLFGRIDGNADGRLTAEEFSGFLGGARKPGGPPANAPGGPPAKGPPAAWDDPDAEFKRIFRRMDADGDGSLTEAEYVERTRWPEAKARAIWRASDGDGDGKVTEREYCRNRHVTDKAKEVFGWIDGDGDGKVTEKEVVAFASRAFREMDRDKDGEVNIPEYLGARWEWDVRIDWLKTRRTRSEEKPNKPAGK